MPKIELSHEFIDQIVVKELRRNHKMSLDFIREKTGDLENYQLADLIDHVRTLLQVREVLEYYGGEDRVPELSFFPEDVVIEDDE